MCHDNLVFSNTVVCLLEKGNSAQILTFHSLPRLARLCTERIEFQLGTSPPHLIQLRHFIINSLFLRNELFSFSLIPCFTSCFLWVQFLLFQCSKFCANVNIKTGAFPVYDRSDSHASSASSWKLNQWASPDVFVMNVSIKERKHTILDIKLELGKQTPNMRYKPRNYTIAGHKLIHGIQKAKPF